MTSSRLLIIDIKAFKHLLDLHVLFSARQTVSADGTPLPIVLLALSMDDEVQYRCAGYIQAEIERYAEFLDDEDADDARKSDADESSGDENEGNQITKEVKARKKAHREGLISFNLLILENHGLITFILQLS